MSTNFQIKIITPEDVFYKGEVSSLIAPGEVGYLGILHDHAPLVTPLVKGVLTLKYGRGEEKKFDVDGGFLEVSNNQVIVLVENITKSGNEAATK